MKRMLCLATAALAALAFLAMAPATQADVADFYKTHSVKIIVGFSAGGGVDTYSRILARHMGEHIPSKPNIIVSNMPGAGSMKAVKSIKIGPKDGTYIVAFNPGNITQSLITPKRIDFDFKKVAYLGSISSESQICYMWHTKGVKTFNQLLKQDLIHMGGSRRGTSAYMMGAIVRNLFGAKIKHVLGYSGRSGQRIAVERGELDGGCGTWDSTPKHWMDKKLINVVIRLTKARPPDMSKNVPYIVDIATAEQKQILKFVLSINDMFRPYIVAKGVPDDRLKTLQDAFMKTVTGAPFLAEVKKARRTVRDPMPGPKVAAMVDEIYKASPEIIKKSAAAIK